MTATTTAAPTAPAMSAVAVTIALVLGMGVGAARGVHVEGHPQPVEPFALEPAMAFAAPDSGVDPFAAPDAGVDPFAAPDSGVDPFASATPALTHRVEPGETLVTIAERYGLDAAAVARSNGIARPSRLRPGRRLLLLPATRFSSPQAARSGAPALDALLSRAAAENGLDPALVRAVAWRESRWDQTARSSRGAVGVLQVMPVTGEAMSRQLGRPLDLGVIEDNVAAGAAYLAARLAARGGDVRRALADYHQGPAAVSRDGVFPVTRRYVDDVLGLRAAFG